MMVQHYVRAHAGEYFVDAICTGLNLPTLQSPARHFPALMTEHHIIETTNRLFIQPAHQPLFAIRHCKHIFPECLGWQREIKC